MIQMVSSTLVLSARIPSWWCRRFPVPTAVSSQFLRFLSNLIWVRSHWLPFSVNGFLSQNIFKSYPCARISTLLNRLKNSPLYGYMYSILFMYALVWSSPMLLSGNLPYFHSVSTIQASYICLCKHDFAWSIFWAGYIIRFQVSGRPLPWIASIIAVHHSVIKTVLNL